MPFGTPVRASDGMQASGCVSWWRAKRPRLALIVGLLAVWSAGQTICVCIWPSAHLLSLCYASSWQLSSRLLSGIKKDDRLRGL